MLYSNHILLWLSLNIVYCRHKLVPNIYEKNPALLGIWVAKMRTWKKKKDKNLTTSSHLQHLKAAGFSWDAKVDPNFYYKIQGDNKKALDVWDENYTALLEYKEEHRDCLVPKSFVVNQHLARWVAKQHINYKAKQENWYHTLTDDKEKCLFDIGFVFNTRTKELLHQLSLKHYKDQWDGFIKRLIAFKEECGHCAVPWHWKGNMQLASWVMWQVSHACIVF
jgi:Helicase associated domain